MPDAWNKVYAAGDDFASPNAFLPFFRALSLRLVAAGFWPISERAQGKTMLLADASGPDYTDDRSTTIAELQPGQYYVGEGVLTATPSVKITTYGTNFVEFGLENSMPDGYTTGDTVLTMLLFSGDAATAIVAPVEDVQPAPQNYFGSTWQHLQAICLQLLERFYEAGFDWSDTNVNDADSYMADWAAAWGSTGNISGFLYPLPLRYKTPTWPPPNGFTRKREREVTTLSADGEDGQLARFIYSLAGQNDDGSTVIRTGEEALDMPATPDDERKYSLQIMVYDGETSAWKLNDDQSVAPDIVTFYGVALPGDIMGEWILNELRDAINLLTVTGLDYTWTNNGVDNHRKAISDTSRAECETNWAAAAKDLVDPGDIGFEAGDDAGSFMYSQDKFGLFGEIPYTLEVFACFGQLTVPNHVERTVKFTASSAGYTGDDLGTDRYNDNGQPIIQHGTYTETATGDIAYKNLYVWDTVTASTDEVVTSSIMLGDPDTRPAWRGTETGGDFYGYFVPDGFGIGENVALIDWSAGFAPYVAT